MSDKSAARIGGPGGLEAARVLHAAQGNVGVRRAAEVRDLELLLEWADIHSGDPQAEPNAVPVSRGGPQLVQLGGEGTPEMVDLEIDEMAIARETGSMATRNATAEALDLRHRLPRLWDAVRALECEPWLARKVARMSRPLPKPACGVVDQAVVAALAQGPRRVLEIAEAKIIEADTAAHAERLAQAERRRGVWFPEPPPGDQLDDQFGTPGLRSVVGRLSAGEALTLQDSVDEIADLLAAHGNHDPDNPPTQAQLRADALALLADPAAVLALLEADHDVSGLVTGARAPSSTSVAQAEPGLATSEHRSTTRRPAVLHLHLHEHTLLGRAAGILRSDELGPLLTDQLADLIGHRHITVQPVVDLHHGRSVNGYEHPDDVKHRTELRTLGDVFPHSTSRPSARVDHDHPAPYHPAGPPGQTGDHNDAPLTRRHHRAKTHLGFTVEQTGPASYRWTTPHGLVRHVDGTGTHRVA